MAHLQILNSLRFCCNILMDIILISEKILILINKLIRNVIGKNYNVWLYSIWKQPTATTKEGILTRSHTPCSYIGLQGL